VIDRRAAAILRLERDDVVVELLREVAEHVDIGARRDARVRDPVDAIENQTAGASRNLPSRSCAVMSRCA
jgi:hypothetical protein